MVKNPPANAGDTRHAFPVPGLGRAPGEGNGNMLQENSVDRGTWQATVHGAARSRAQLSTLYYYTTYLDQWHLCFCVFLLFISILLFQLDRSFINSCEADLILMNSFSFHVSGKLFLSPSILSWVEYYELTFFFSFFFWHFAGKKKVTQCSQSTYWKICLKSYGWCAFVHNKFLLLLLLLRFCPLIFDNADFKKYIMWELWVKFYWQYEDYSPGDSVSDSSEKLLQRGKGKVSMYVILVKRKYL